MIGCSCSKTEVGLKQNGRKTSVGRGISRMIGYGYQFCCCNLLENYNFSHLALWIKVIKGFLFYVFSLHSRKWFGKQGRGGLKASVSRKFHTISEEKIMQLKTEQMKKRSENKMLWAVRAFNEWRVNRLNDVIHFDVRISEANLEELHTLTKENLDYAMCRFIPEVRKVNGGEDYPGRTLYEMCVAIQKFVNIRGK